MKSSQTTFNIAELNNSKIYDGFDFNDIWTMSNNGPKLKTVTEIEKDKEYPSVYWEEADSFAGGKGTKSNPYLIATAEQLVKAVKNSNQNIYYRLIRNIDLNGKLWPTQVDSGYFIHTFFFDGNNKTVSNLTLKNGCGLFACALQNGYIKNLNLIHITGSSCAGLIPRLDDSQITNCNLTGSLKAATHYNQGVTMSDVAGLSEMIGDNVTLDKCTINMDLKGFRNVGSIYSYILGNSVNVTNCGIQGTLFGANNGLFGCNKDIEYNMNNSYISVLCDDYFSGKNFYYNSDLANGNGIPLTTEQMQFKSSYKDFDFNKIWDINPNINNGYPYLRTTSNKKINYVLNGGVNVSYPETDYIPGNVVTLPKPTRNGYAFDGWYKTSDFSGNPVDQISASEKNDITFYAKWSCLHLWDAGRVTKQPTVTTAGVKIYTCTKCKATKTEAIKATGLKTPTLKATVNANGTFKLSWNKVTGAEKYELYIKQADGSYKLMKTTTGTSFTTAFATYGKQFSYKMRAVASNVKSSYSSAVNATNNKKLQTPTMKVIVNANGTFKLSWNKVSGVEKYELYIKQANGSYKLMKTTTSTSFTTAFATYGKQYSYKMRAITSKNSTATSAFSAAVNVTNNKKLQTPTLKVAVNANGTFKLFWNKVTGAEKYELYIKQANGSYKLMKTTTSTSFTTAFATYGKQFSYKMRAVTSKNKSAASAYSSVVNTKNTKKLQTPSLKVAVNKNGSFKLSWGKVTGATSY
ncbi:MAG: InlB B-repeat-containing protein, partial [Eubacterium sp.]|nr:InlB B-repeat-containing protein [Eubacterium sp.]